MPRTLGRMLLLSAVAVVTIHGTAGVQEESSLGRILEFQKKLNEKVDYEMPIQTTVAKALDDLLTKADIPYTVNEVAFVHAMQDKNVVKTADVGPIDPMKQVTRAAVLKMLLEQIPASDEKGVVDIHPPPELRGNHHGGGRATRVLRRPQRIAIAAVGLRFVQKGTAAESPGGTGAHHGA